MKFRALVLFIPLVLLLSMCKNDLKLNAPYKEFPSIFAVLNPQAKLQMIRINKVFLGEGDANQMAKVADSINYPAGELIVTLKHFNNNIIETNVFHDSVVIALEGKFNPIQRIYVCSDKLATYGTYTLTVINKKTGNSFSARASSLDSVRPSGFIPLTSPYYPYNPGTAPNEYIDYSNQNLTYDIKFRPFPNEAKLFQPSIRLHFYDSIFTGNTYRYVDYNFNNLALKDVATSGPFYGMLKTDFKGFDIFSTVGSALSKMSLPDVIGRKMYKIQYLIYSTSQDYIDYIEYSKPSLSLGQNKPLYTNFDNAAAIGIFTFRSRFSITKELSSSFINEFASNPYTCRYQFLAYDLKPRTCR